MEILNAVSFREDNTAWDFKDVRMVRHQGTVIAIAEVAVDGGTPILMYCTLDLNAQAANEAEHGEQSINAPLKDQPWNEARFWTGFDELELPKEVRLAGASLITMPTSFRSAGKWVCLSDGHFVHIFRAFQPAASDGNDDPPYIIHHNRFILREAAQSTAAPTPEGEQKSRTGKMVLRPKPQARFMQSGLPDLAAGPKDNISPLAPDGREYIEPATSFYNVITPDNGHFGVCLTPSNTPGGARWQFIYNQHDDQATFMVSDSFAQIKDGSVDITDRTTDRFYIQAALTDQANAFENLTLTGNAAMQVYRLQIETQDAVGDVSEAPTLKKVPGQPRLFVAAPMTGQTTNTTSSIVTFDLPLRNDGNGSPDVPYNKVANPALIKPKIYPLQLPKIKRNGSYAKPKGWQPSLPMLGWMQVFEGIDSSPSLVDGGDGHLHVYGTVTDAAGKKQMCGVTLDTSIRLPVYELPSKGGNILSIQLLPALVDVENPVQLTPFSKPDFFVLNIHGSGRNESWAALPNDVDQIAMILNGEAAADTEDPRVISKIVPHYLYNYYFTVDAYGIDNSFHPRRNSQLFDGDPAFADRLVKPHDQDLYKPSAANQSFVYGDFASHTAAATVSLRRAAGGGMNVEQRAIQEAVINQSVIAQKPGTDAKLPAWLGPTCSHDTNAAKFDWTGRTASDLTTKPAPILNTSEIGELAHAAQGDLTLEAWVNQSQAIDPKIAWSTDQQPELPASEIIALDDRNSAANFALYLLEQDQKTYIASSLGEFRHVWAEVGHGLDGHWCHLAASWSSTHGVRIGDQQQLTAIGQNRTLNIGDSFRFDMIFSISDAFHNKTTGRDYIIADQGLQGGRKFEIYATFQQAISYQESKTGLGHFEMDFGWRIVDAANKVVAGCGTAVKSMTVTSIEPVWLAGGFKISESLATDTAGQTTKTYKGPDQEDHDYDLWVDAYANHDDVSKTIAGTATTTTSVTRSNTKWRGRAPLSSRHAALTIGREFDGVIGMFRFWDDDHGDALLPCPIAPLSGDANRTNPADQPLEFSFPEGHGIETESTDGSITLALTSHDMWTASNLAATADLFLNGERLRTEPCKAINRPAKKPTKSAFTGVSIGRYLNGRLIEIRVWNRIREQQNIVDTLFARANGSETGLAAHWPLNATSPNDTTLFAETVNGINVTANNTGMLDNHGTPPPTGFDMPLFAAGDPTRTNPLAIAAAQAVSAVDYGEVQRNAEGGLEGAFKRCYGYVQSVPGVAEGTTRGACVLTTGFAVGELDLRYLGQVQTEPELIGYIEGAPPVPSENLTVPYFDNPRAYQHYAGTSSVTLSEGQDKSVSYSSTRDTGATASATAAGGPEVRFQSGISVGLGVEHSADIFGWHADWLLKGTIDTSYGHIHGANRRLERGTGLAFKMEAAGDWVQNGSDKQLRYMPANKGAALVRSRVANLYGLHMRKTGAIIGIQIVPDNTIEPDENIILFDIKKSYTMQGSLDGRINGVELPEFAGQQGHEKSYFRPKEAADMQARIAREEAETLARYNDFDPRGEVFVPSEKTTVGYGPAKAADWRREQAQRNLVNSYVWTADGGFFIESQKTLNTREESESARFSFSGSVGFENDFQINPGPKIDYTASLGINVSRQVSKSSDDSDGFSLDVTIDGEGNLSAFDDTSGNYKPGGVPVPGKVTAYRCKTFYLAPASEHFETLFDDVIDPAWLKQLDNPDAALMRLLEGRANRVWRVMHRVTYVARVPSKNQQAAAYDEQAPTTPVVGTETNRALILKTVYFVNDNTAARTRDAALQSVIKDYQNKSAELNSASPAMVNRIKSRCLRYVLGMNANELATNPSSAANKN